MKGGTGLLGPTVDPPLDVAHSANFRWLRKWLWEFKIFLFSTALTVVEN